MLKVADLEYKRLSFLTQFHSDPIQGIPKEGGIYYWVYFPDFDPKTITVSDLEIKLKEFTKKSLMFSETIIGSYKFQAIISEQGYPTKNDTLFGLSESKNLKLKKYLADPVNLNFFHSFFKEVCFFKSS